MTNEAFINALNEAAARDLDGLVFPENHLGEERKLLQ